MPSRDDWDPGTYARFGDLRLRPALDLLTAIGTPPDGPVIDLGCGAGAMGAALHARFGLAPDGIDASPAMIKRAQATGDYAHLAVGDIAGWQPDVAPAVVFSNAALQWLPDHATLFPRLAAILKPGGWLAVQMPAQTDAPSHSAWRAAFAEVAPRLPAPVSSSILPAEQYFDLLAPLGTLKLWQCDYFQHLPRGDGGHPVRAFTEATYGRPFLASVPPADQAVLVAGVEARLTAAYPRRSDGSVLFPFRRIFLTLQI